MKKTLFVILLTFVTVAMLGAALLLTLLNPQFKPTTVMKLMQDGQRAMTEANFTEAIEHFRLVLYLDETKLEAYLRLADLYVMEDEPREALYYVEQGLLHWPENEDLLKARENLKTVIAILEPDESDDEDFYTPTPVETPEPDAANDPEISADPNATADPDASPADVEDLEGVG